MVLLSHTNGTAYLYDIFALCLQILMKPFYICGIKVTLLSFICFDIVAFLVLYVVFYLFVKY